MQNILFYFYIDTREKKDYRRIAFLRIYSNPVFTRTGFVKRNAEINPGMVKQSMTNSSGRTLQF